MSKGKKTKKEKKKKAHKNKRDKQESTFIIKIYDESSTETREK